MRIINGEVYDPINGIDGKCARSALMKDGSWHRSAAGRRLMRLEWW